MIGFPPRERGRGMWQKPSNRALDGIVEYYVQMGRMSISSNNKHDG